MHLARSTAALAAALVAVASIAATGCGSGVDPGPCGAMPDRVPPCLTGTAGRTCVMASGSGSGLVCMGTAWACPSGSVPQDQCGCFGTTPGAECPAATCGGMPAPSFACLPGAEGRACGDVALQPVCVGATWSCPAGSVQGASCGCRAGPTGTGLPPRMVGDACPPGALDAASDATSDAAGDAVVADDGVTRADAAPDGE